MGGGVLENVRQAGTLGVFEGLAHLRVLSSVDDWCAVMLPGAGGVARAVFERRANASFERTPRLLL
ncbi:hypothetical protein AC230_01485 [Streptomyces caatingaensis]|uniref:Uncharacterized protein n=1 Tax=Streptomyces caatingaensis TaxID=1678637 RepID=A0A0K9XJ37_9ACTN|nr:hypothetical protein AC230_01485 [Streptomyces caatingaensis]